MNFDYLIFITFLILSIINFSMLRAYKSKFENRKKIIISELRDFNKSQTFQLLCKSSCLDHYYFESIDEDKRKIVLRENTDFFTHFGYFHIINFTDDMILIKTIPILNSFISKKNTHHHHMVNTVKRIIL